MHSCARNQRMWKTIYKIWFFFGCARVLACVCVLVVAATHPAQTQSIQRPPPHIHIRTPVHMYTLSYTPAHIHTSNCSTNFYSCCCACCSPALAAHTCERTGFALLAICQRNATLAVFFVFFRSFDRPKTSPPFRGTFAHAHGAHAMSITAAGKYPPTPPSLTHEKCPSPPILIPASPPKCWCIFFN